MFPISSITTHTQSIQSRLAPPMASKTQLIMSKGWDTIQSVAAVVISSIHSPQSKKELTLKIRLINFSVNFLLVKLYQVGGRPWLSPYSRSPFWKSHFLVHMSINKKEKIDLFQLPNHLSHRSHINPIYHGFWILFGTGFERKEKNAHLECHLKVSYLQNEFMKIKFLPKNERKIARISALTHRAEILAIFCSFFGRNFIFTNSFWN